MATTKRRRRARLRSSCSIRFSFALSSSSPPSGGEEEELDLVDHGGAKSLHLGQYGVDRGSPEIDVDRADAHLLQRAEVLDQVGLAAGEQASLAVRRLWRHRGAVALHAEADAHRRRI